MSYLAPVGAECASSTQKETDAEVSVSFDLLF